MNLQDNTTHQELLNKEQLEWQKQVIREEMDSDGN